MSNTSGGRKVRNWGEGEAKVRQSEFGVAAKGSSSQDAGEPEREGGRPSLNAERDSGLSVDLADQLHDQRNLGRLIAFAVAHDDR